VREACPPPRQHAVRRPDTPGDAEPKKPPVEVVLVDEFVVVGSLARRPREQMPGLKVCDVLQSPTRKAGMPRSSYW
jgi:hypothetical protein